MLIRFIAEGFSECWNGIFYKKLSHYPYISDWEVQNIIDFICYEKCQGRKCELEGDERIIAVVRDALQKEEHARVPLPAKIEECTACPFYRGCMTDLVCHTSPVENAIQILQSGSLLSPVQARKKPAVELMAETRNAANDPADYFDYIMFSWGNCQAGDRLIVERKQGRFPNDSDLSIHFTPGVSFFFKYNKLITHPDAVFDGVLPLIIKSEVVLKDWVHAVIILADKKDLLKNAVSKVLEDKAHYVVNDCRDIWEWSEKVCEFARSIPQPA